MRALDPKEKPEDLRQARQLLVRAHSTTLYPFAARPFRQDSTRSARSKRSDGPYRQNSSHNEDGDNSLIFLRTPRQPIRT